MKLKRQNRGAASTGLASLASALVGLQPAFAVDTTQLGAAATAFARGALVHTANPVHVRAAPLDERLKLADCPEALVVQLPPGSRWAANTLIQVRCSSSTVRWSLLVPVQIESDVPVLVLRTSAARGSPLGAADVTAETRRVPGVSADYVNSAAALSRHHLRRTLGAGTLLQIDDLEPDLLVKRGQMVTVVAEADGLRIQGEAVAMADARAGDRLRAQNRASLKIVEGVVDIQGVVRVGP